MIISWYQTQNKYNISIMPNKIHTRRYTCLILLLTVNYRTCSSGLNSLFWLILPTYKWFEDLAINAALFLWGQLKIHLRIQ